MSGKKDINRIRELIFGKDIERFDEAFSTINGELEHMKSEQNMFEKRMLKQFTQMETVMNDLKETQSDIAKGLRYQGHKMDLYVEEMDMSLKKSLEQSSNELKQLKNELKMHIEAKLTQMNRVKISHNELSEIFSSLSTELKVTDNTDTYARK
ncbi:MAG: Unknown protein [uncultured Sulfurovum sp.]|uniref:Uncharacterized protein n=1 Tax=uncultured Sulfurovum sp. TaxID=269237 RepID=A0A6S6UL49_9BACT|nr:MAG: Unknown protein [uncultured Sulfurovum sp.]